MSAQSQDSEKSHEPTEKKLLDARRRGEIVRSNDVTTAASYIGFWTGLTLFGTTWLHNIANNLMLFFDRPVEISRIIISSSSQAVLMMFLNILAPPLAAWFIIPATFVILSLFSQRGILFTPNKIFPKFSRISIIANIKNKYGRSGFFEFFKSFLKLFSYCLVLGLFIYINLNTIIGIVYLFPNQITTIIINLSLNLLLLIAAISIGLAIIDYLWQYYDFMHKNRMSYKELQDEQKEAEGDPHFKAQRRRRAQEIAMNKMLSDVPYADVIIVNPTHYAVALKWDSSQSTAPICVAKGKDEIARIIRETAIKYDIPIHSDPPTARAIFSTVEIGKEINQDLYGPVAIAIRFARDTRSKNKIYS